MGDFLSAGISGRSESVNMGPTKGTELLGAGASGRLPQQSEWRQQSWRMVYNPLYGAARTAALLHSAIAIVFAALACVLAAHDGRVRSTGPIAYRCALNSTCDVSFEVREDIVGPAMLSYELSPFYQNNRRYVHSWSYAQLTSPDDLPYRALADACFPRVSAHNDPSEPPLVPCGLAPAARFTDTFRLRDEHGVPVRLERDGRWVRGLDRFEPKRAPADGTLADLVGWVRASPLAHFRKPYARIERGLPAGRYTMGVAVTYAVRPFGGTAAFSISSWSALGGRHAALWLLACANCACSAAMAAHCLISARRGSSTPLQRAAAALAYFRSEAAGAALGPGSIELGVAGSGLDSSPSRQIHAVHKMLVPRPPWCRARRPPGRL
jgi:hypothetical protein